MQHYLRLQYQRLDPDYHLPRALVIKISRHTIKNHHPASMFIVSGGRRFAFRGGQQDSVNIVDGGSGLPHRTRLLSLPRRQILRRPRGRSSGTTTDQPLVTWKGVVVVNGTYCLVLINNTSLEWSTTPSSRLPRLLLSRCVRPYWVSRLVNGNAIWWR